MKLKQKINMGVVVGCAGLGVCSSAFSADEATKGKNVDVIETIIVTAERQAQPIQKVPASIQAFSAEDLTNSGINSIEALQNATTGLIMSNNAGQGHAYIRGIGTEIIGGGYEGGVAVYVDGVYQSRPTSLISQFIDVERIEVMKGPQGTLYGRNATGGAINIITAAPSKVSEGQVDAQLGRFSDKTFRGTFSGPLSDGVSGRLSLLSSKNDGYVQNILLNNRNDSDTQAVRGSLALAPSSDLSIRLNAHYIDKKDTLLIKPLNPGGTNLICGAPTPFTDDTKMFSQDFTLTSVKAGPIQWTVLASYMHQTVKSPYSCTLPLAGVTLTSDPKVTTDSYGIGGQGSYSFDNGVKLTAGARYSSDEKKIVDTTTMNGMVTATQNQENKWSAWTPKLVAEYSPSKETMYFASVTKGFKGGGYNTFTIQAPFNPEHVINYEAGMKSTMLNGKLRINASVFTMEYSDMQLAVVHTVPGGGGAFVSETKNAAKATIDGIEIGVVA
ncbi:MAG: TonB-dependent receptor, partial [Proteobacteria bacterium]|nr:TonB-dependent receptor [Pseudomonadota bacterium]